MGLEDAASAARLKVSAALLPSLRDASRTASQRFHLDAPSWFDEPKTPELLPAVADAVWDDRRIVARYRRRDTEVERELEPYGLVLKAGVWYLCAHVPSSSDDGGGGSSGSGGGGSFRTYRIDRFLAVDADGDRFTRDEEFDLPPTGTSRQNDSPGRSCMPRSSYGSRRRECGDCRTSWIPSPPGTP